VGSKDENDKQLSAICRGYTEYATNLGVHRDKGVLWPQRTPLVRDLQHFFASITPEFKHVLNADQTKRLLNRTRQWTWQYTHEAHSTPRSHMHAHSYLVALAPLFGLHDELANETRRYEHTAARRRSTRYQLNINTLPFGDMPVMTPPVALDIDQGRYSNIETLDEKHNAILEDEPLAGGHALDDLVGERIERSARWLREPGTRPKRIGMLPWAIYLEFYNMATVAWPATGVVLPHPLAKDETLRRYATLFDYKQNYKK